MLRSTLFLRPLLLAALPSFALFAAACSDDDHLLTHTGGAGESGTTGGNASAGAAGKAGSAGDATGGTSEAAGSAGISDTGSAGEAPINNPLGLGPAPVPLGAAGQYAILAKSAISNVPTSAITGDLGLSPAAATYITGFSLKAAGPKWTTPQVVGSVFAADNGPPTTANLTVAVADMQTAYTDAAGRATPDFVNLGAGTIGGLTLEPGLYKWASSVTVPTDITLAGAADDVWIFQVSGDLKLSAAKAMILSGGAQAKNIFWQVAGLVNLGTTSHSEGIVLCKTAIELGTGASINGRLLSQTAVTLAGNTVSAP